MSDIEQHGEEVDGEIVANEKLKYGRIFTEDDLAELINVATASATLGIVLDAGECVSRFESEQGPTTFPADEPVFVVRAKDKAGLSTIMHYEERALIEGCGGDHQQNVKRAIAAFTTFAQEQSERMKIPD